MLALRCSTIQVNKSFITYFRCCANIKSVKTNRVRRIENTNVKRLRHHAPRYSHIQPLVQTRKLQGNLYLNMYRSKVYCVILHPTLNFCVSLLGICMYLRSQGSVRANVSSLTHLNQKAALYSEIITGVIIALHSQLMCDMRSQLYFRAVYTE